MAILRLLDAILSRIEQALIGGLLLLASFVLFANVVARYGFNSGFSWAEELTRYAIVWMVFVGSSVAARNGAHIGVDVLARILSGSRFGKVLTSSVDLLCITFSIFLIVLGWELAAQVREFGQLSPAMQIPLWTVQLAIPVGGVLMALRFSQRFWGGLTDASNTAQLENLN